MNRSFAYEGFGRRSTLLLTASGVALLAVSPVEAQLPVFENARHDFAKRTLALTAGDLDLDGRDEAVTTNVSGDLSIVRFDEDLQILGTTHLPLCADPLPARLADFDSDGDLDLFAACRSGPSAFVFANDGLGSLTANPIALFGAPSGFDVGDLDLDGDLDVAVSRNATGIAAVSILENDGTASFTPTPTSGSNFAARDLGIADVTGDGRPDVTCLRESTSLLMFYVLRGDGAGGLVYDPNLASTNAGFFGSKIALADADSDGDIDAWFGPDDDSELGFAKNDGSGKMLTPVKLLTQVLGYEIRDLDGDGRVDVLRFGAAAYETGGKILRNYGNGNFAPIEEFASRGRGTVGDFDGDGEQDIVSATDHPEENTIGAVRRGVLGRFHAAYALGVPLEKSIAIGKSDFDHDGDLDSLWLGAVHTESNRRLVLGRNDGAASSGWLDRMVAQTGIAGLAYPRAVVADIDSDGNDDVVTWDYISSSIYIANGVGDGTFAGFVGQHVWLSALVGEGCVGDFDLDSDLDLAIHAAGSGGAASLVLALENDGVGGIAHAPIAVPLTNSFLNAGGLAGTDLNLDGFTDFVATTHQITPKLSFLTPVLSTGPMSWSEQPSLGIGAVTSYFVKLAHLDFDGHLDAAVSTTPLSSLSPSLPRLEFFRGQPGGSFTPISSATTGATEGRGVPEFSDLDGDGVLDLVSESVTDGLADVRVQTSPFHFERVGRFAASRNYGGGVLDADGDGVGELLALDGLVVPRMKPPPVCSQILIPFGTGCAPGSPYPLVLDGHGCTGADEVIHLSLLGAAVNAPVLLLISDERGNHPLGGGCSLYLKSILAASLPILLAPSTGIESSGPGTFGVVAKVPAAIPANSSLCLQAFSTASISGIPAAASNGLCVVFR